jgi:hypothetical protein
MPPAGRAKKNNGPAWANIINANARALSSKGAARSRTFRTLRGRGCKSGAHITGGAKYFLEVEDLRDRSLILKEGIT